MKIIYIDKNGAISQKPKKDKFLCFKIGSDGYKVYADELLYENDNEETLLRTLFNIITHFKSIKESNYNIELVKDTLSCDNIILRSKRTINYDNVDERMFPKPEDGEEFRDFFSLINETYGIMELKNNYETASISFSKTLDLYRNYDYLFTNDNEESVGIKYYIDENIRDICIEYSDKDRGISVDLRSESGENYTGGEIIYEFTTYDNYRKINEMILSIDLYKCKYSVDIFSMDNYQDITFRGNFDEDLKKIINIDIEMFIEFCLNPSSKKSKEIERRIKNGTIYEQKF